MTTMKILLSENLVRVQRQLGPNSVDFDVIDKFISTHGRCENILQEESLNRDRSSGPTHDIQSLKRPALNDESSFEELVTREVGHNLQVYIFRPLK